MEQKTEHEKKLLTEQETARYLNISRSWLRAARCYNWPNAPRFIRLGRAIRYPVDELDVFIKERNEGRSNVS